MPHYIARSKQSGGLTHLYDKKLPMEDVSNSFAYSWAVIAAVVVFIAAIVEYRVQKGRRR